MKKELEGIHEKTERANECVSKLGMEIATFFYQSEYPTIPNPDDKMFQVIFDYHLNRSVPIRFSVLAGEIVHHLRSSFDHLIWQLSDSAYREDHANWIEFPVFDVIPSSKDELARYERKVKGVTNLEAKTFIERLQPHNGPNPLGDALSIIHNMDRFDKHRELAIIFPAIVRSHGPLAVEAIIKNYKAKSDSSRAELTEAMKVDSKISAHIAFREFGYRKDEPVIPSLTELIAYTEAIMEESERFFP